MCWSDSFEIKTKIVFTVGGEELLINEPAIEMQEDWPMPVEKLDFSCYTFIIPFKFYPGRS